MKSVAGTLVVKLLIVAALLALILPAVGRVHWGQIAWLAVLLTAVSYILGDRVVLPAMGNSGAVVADFIIAVGLLSLAPVLAPGVRLGFGGALVAGGAVAVAEILYHQYLLQQGVGVR